MHVFIFLVTFGLDDDKKNIVSIIIMLHNTLLKNPNIQLYFGQFTCLFSNVLKSDVNLL